MAVSPLSSSASTDSLSSSPNTLILTSQDPIERMDQFIKQVNSRGLSTLEKLESMLNFENGCLCIVKLQLTYDSIAHIPSQIIASRSYFVDNQVWGEIDPRKVVYSLLLDEMGLSPASEPHLPPIDVDEEDAKKTCDMAVGFLSNLGNPDYVPTQETMVSLLRQVGKMSFGALKSLDALKGVSDA